MAFSRSRSVGEEEKAEVVGDQPDTVSFVFLLFFFCFSFLFFLCFFCCLPLIFAHSLLLFVGMLVPLSLDFFCCGWPLLLRKAPKRGWWILLWWSSPGQGLSVA